MALTDNLGLYLLAENQQGAEVTFNESMYKLDACCQLSAVTLQATPPVGAYHGIVHIVVATATDEWAGYEDFIAYYVSNQWKFIPPVKGMRAYDQENSRYVYYDGAYPGGEWVVDSVVIVENSLSGHIVAPQINDYCLVLYPNVAMSITKISMICETGVAAGQLYVDGSLPSNHILAFTTTLNHVTDFDSGTGGDQPIAVAVGEKLELHISGVADCLDLQFTLMYT